MTREQEYERLLEDRDIEERFIRELNDELGDYDEDSIAYELACRELDNAENDLNHIQQEIDAFY